MRARRSATHRVRSRLARCSPPRRTPRSPPRISSRIVHSARSSFAHPRSDRWSPWKWWTPRTRSPCGGAADWSHWIMRRSSPICWWVWRTARPFHTRSPPWHLMPSPSCGCSPARYSRSFGRCTRMPRSAHPCGCRCSSSRCREVFWASSDICSAPPIRRRPCRSRGMIPAARRARPAARFASRFPICRQVATGWSSRSPTMPPMDAPRATLKSSGPTSAIALAVMTLLLSWVPPAALRAAAQRPRTPAEHRARDSQRDFESLRRFHLPVVRPRHGCDVSIGRLCYWDDNDDPALPPEAARVSAAREAFRHVLDSLAVQDSTSDFIMGQRVRYALEAPTDSDATAILAHCSATPWWCNALRGLVWHHAGQEALSAAAYDSALAAMPDTLRCKWLDVDPWLPQGMDDPRADGPACMARVRASMDLFWLAAPLLTWRPRAARDEFLA